MFVVPLAERTHPTSAPSPPFALGVEEELHLVDPVTDAPLPVEETTRGGPREARFTRAAAGAPVLTRVG